MALPAQKSFAALADPLKGTGVKALLNSWHRFTQIDAVLDSVTDNLIISDTPAPDVRDLTGPMMLAELRVYAEALGVSVPDRVPTRALFSGFGTQSSLHQPTPFLIPDSAVKMGIAFVTEYLRF